MIPANDRPPEVIGRHLLGTRNLTNVYIVFAHISVSVRKKMVKKIFNLKKHFKMECLLGFRGLPWNLQLWLGLCMSEIIQIPFWNNVLDSLKILFKSNVSCATPLWYNNILWLSLKPHWLRKEIRIWMITAKLYP